MTSNSQAPIDVRGLTKNFGNVRALDGLDLTVHEGEVHGFLGPNGAGKSTTMRVLVGLTPADTGTATVCGRRCGERHVVDGGEGPVGPAEVVDGDHGVSLVRRRAAAHRGDR